ncbi:leukotriene B4 receptor 1-like [Tiliqua scincoides]|uniref:leukotriene B4 receptor 1-like n=1 Tax=Tiliqua scincoides TaxID=71010 RepID=UPI003462C2CE
MVGKVQKQTTASEYLKCVSNAIISLFMLEFYLGWCLLNCICKCQACLRHMMILLNTTETPGNSTAKGNAWAAADLFATLFLGACFLIGIPGNGLVVWTILTKFSQRSFTIILILNLALADLMALSTVPIWIYYFANTWVFGDITCKLLMYLVYLTVYASIFLITLISLHRFAVVVFPFVAPKWRRPCVMRCTLLAVWLSAAAFATPIVPASSTQLEEGECLDEAYSSDGQRLAANLVETLSGFVIPFTVLSICYTCVARRVRELKQRQKMRTGKLITAVIVAFFICWLPYHIFNLIVIFALLMRGVHPDKTKELLETARNISYFHGAVAFLSSCLNPILYAFAARSFRGGLRETNFAKLFGKMHEDTEEKSTRDTPDPVQPL